MAITKRVYCLHNGNPFDHGATLTKFVNREGIVCNHTDDHCWWEDLGLFPTKAKALAYAKNHHINLSVHSITVHTDWVYGNCPEDMVKYN